MDFYYFCFKLIQNITLPLPRPFLVIKGISPKKVHSRTFYFPFPFDIRGDIASVLLGILEVVCTTQYRTVSIIIYNNSSHDKYSHYLAFYQFLCGNASESNIKGWCTANTDSKV